MQPEVTVIATELAFPEGPIALPDGSIILVEIKAGRLTRVRDGVKKRSLNWAAGRMARQLDQMGTATSAITVGLSG